MRKRGCALRSRRRIGSARRDAFEPVDLDTLCERAGLTPDAASAILLKLERDGYLCRLAGGLLQRMR
jgi:predicted Rossmann fold nucleotide-binding protein DprA/Smf involved in DNA uptake